MREIKGLDPAALPEDVLRSDQPLLLRGLAAEWPVVRAAQRSGQEASAYLRSFWRGASVGLLSGPPEIDGRIFYSADFGGFNFQREIVKLDGVLDRLNEMALSYAAEPQPLLYVGSTTVDACLPGYRAANDFGFGGLVEPLASIWLGNRSRIAAHQDLPDNLACVVAGRRRFVLFAPDELSNLYIGPLDFTPAGQAISLVDFAKPDLQKFPRFAQAMTRACSVELGPGDALFIPSMWWHYVEALDSFNVLINYWWRQSPAFMDAPIGALMLAMLSVRDLPAAQRQAWHAQFKHYVFESQAGDFHHIPDAALGSLAPMDELRARQLRAQLVKRLNR